MIEDRTMFIVVFNIAPQTLVCERSERVVFGRKY
jgi:hypothetical protein